MPPKIFFGSTLARSTSVFLCLLADADFWFLQLCQHATKYGFSRPHTKSAACHLALESRYSATTETEEEIKIRETQRGRETWGKAREKGVWLNFSCSAETDRGEGSSGGEEKERKKQWKTFSCLFFCPLGRIFQKKYFFFLRHSFSHGPPHFESQELVFFICSGYIMFSFFPAGDMHGRRRWCCDERGAQGTDSPLYPFPFFLLVVFSSPPSPPCLSTSKQMRGPSSLLLLSPPLLGMGLVPSPTTKISPRPRKETKGENAWKDIFSFEFEPVIGSTPFLHAIKGNQNRPNLKHFQGSVTFFKYMCNS